MHFALLILFLIVIIFFYRSERDIKRAGKNYRENNIRNNTVLSQSVEAGAYNSICNQEDFAKGVVDSRAMNLLQSSFGVRTNDLFHRMTKRENYFYLSGLLIGSELQNLKRSAKLILVANPALSILYQKALEVLGFHHRKVLDAEECLLKGQIKCYWRITA